MRSQILVQEFQKERQAVRRCGRQGRQTNWMVTRVGEQEEESVSPQSGVHQELRWRWSGIVPDLPRIVTDRWGERQGEAAWVPDVPSMCGSCGDGGC